MQVVNVWSDLHYISEISEDVLKIQKIPTILDLNEKVKLSKPKKK